MITKKVNRYYCEFCKKSNCSASSISRHEKSCTLNPDRICRMCTKLGLDQSEMSDLLKILPTPVLTEDDIGLLTLINGKEIESAIEKLRSVTENCPVCIFATIRQMGIPVPAIKSFNFTEECKSAWACLNDAQADYNIY